MKKFINLFFIIALVAVGFTSCEEKEDVPAKIPGMGDTPGELEVKEPFALPEGLVITEVQGIDEGVVTVDNILNQSNSLKSAQDFNLSDIFGCGGSYSGNRFRAWITIRLTIQNTSQDKKCFRFEQGLLFEVSDQQYQNGVLCNDVDICLEPNTYRHVYMWIVCVNKGKDGSASNVTYKIKGVSSSRTLWSQCLNRIKRKKTNWRHYRNGNLPSELKAANTDTYDLEKYKEVADHIQNAVWTLTNDGNDLSEEQVNYLESLPDLDE